MQPRLIRLRDAANYLGMDRNRFNNEVRPFLITLKIGQQGIAFDRIDLDRWVNEFKKHTGKPAQRTMHWQRHEIQTLLNEKNPPKIIKKTVDQEFQELITQLTKKKNMITKLNDTN